MAKEKSKIDKKHYDEDFLEVDETKLNG